MYKKPVISFEGVEGSGKTSHIENVAKFLRKKKIQYVKIREPGGSFNSEKIRKLILNHNSKFNKNTDLLLYLAARSENMSIIKKNYRKKIILLDRFVHSTIAYQHFGMGVDLDTIKFINNYLLKDIEIDFTFLNIVNTKNLLLRLKKRKKLNRYDKFSGKFYKKVQSGFLKILKNNKKCLIVDSNLDININKKKIINKINKLL